jgi:3',5'-cyclic AMP phosphodiesterase CpdA
MKTIAAVSVLLLLTAALGSALEIIKGPYLQDVTQTGITIMWETDEPATSEVRYGESEDLDRYKGDKKAVKIHEIRIEGLTPEAYYRYKVISQAGEKEVRSEVYVFRTAPRRDTPFRFAVWGDNRTDYRKCEEVAQLIASQKPDIVINVGDVVSNGEVYEQWGREYFIPLRHFASSTPSYIAIGNHERGAHWFDDFVSQPGNEHWFAFTYGNSRFIILDTNRPYNPGSEQYDWLIEELNSDEFKKAAFRFVFFHHPPYSEQWDSPGYTGEAGVRAYLVPILERYGVDIVFSGHTHDYERGKRVLEDDREIYYIITGGGGSALDRVETKEWDVIQLHKSTYHCVVVDVNGGVLNFKAVGLDGQVIDSFSKVSLDEMARLAGVKEPFLEEQLEIVEGRDLMEDRFTFAAAGDTRSWLTVYQPETWMRIIEELNRIRPEFVIDIGDIISRGYTKDPDLLMREWREYFKAVSKAEVPVLPVAGNHDVWSEMSQMFWRRMVGDLWYSFNYGNSHFITLCSDQARPNHISKIGPEQLEWLKEDLELNGDAQHIFVFLHKPLWRDKNSGWDKVHELLKMYNTEAVIAGHAHIYTRDEDRDGIKYIISGGGGAEMGSFREAGSVFHYMLITVDEDKVYYSIVEPGSVQGIDFVTSASSSIASKASRAISLTSSIPVETVLSESGAEVRLKVSNIYDRAIELLAIWDLPPGFRVYPLVSRVNLDSRGKGELSFNLHLDDPQATWGQTPRLTVVYPGEDGRKIKIDRYISLTGSFAPKRVLASYFSGSRLPSYPHIGLTGGDPKDLSLRMAFLWDKDIFYLNAEMRDDVRAEGDSLSIELEIEGRRIELVGDSEGKFTLSVDGRKGEVGSSVRFSRHDDRTSLSVLLPWETIEVKPDPGDLIGVRLEVTDSDEGRDEEIVRWEGDVVVAPAP